MAETNDGGPAFPTGASGETWQDRDGNTLHEFKFHGGMSVRDQFAAHAMAALIISGRITIGPIPKETGEEMLRTSYQFADFAVAVRAAQ